MPYDKGDFTQQGIDGYVNGGLLLNNKRDINARLSTDEETEGIDDVDIVIKDHLNDLEYHITGENLVVGENVIGGGESSYSPTFTMKVLNITATTAYLDAIIMMDNLSNNNILVNNALPVEPPHDISFEPNIEGLVNGVYAKEFISETETTTYCVGIKLRIQNAKIQTPYVIVSEMVNCELLTVEDSATFVKPINTAIPASFKITYGIRESR